MPCHELGKTLYWYLTGEGIDMSSTRPLVAIDLFSGCGGLTVGLKQAGFRVIGAVDVDPLSVETYRANHPEVRIWQMDIRDIEVSELRELLGVEKGQLDLLAGCPPCQGFSTIRTLNGHRHVNDPRNDLVYELLRFVEGFHPKAVMMENVPGLAKDKRLRDVCRQLAKLGYSAHYRVLNAAEYGVPQRRSRMILLGSRLGPVEFTAPKSNRLTVRDAIGWLPEPGQSGDPLHDAPERRSQPVMDLIRRIPSNGGSRTDLGFDDQLDCHKKCNGFRDVYGRMAWDGVAPTITSGCINPSKGRFLHPVQHRAITLREAALLQSFPPEYSFSLSRGKYSVARLIGNALPPEFVRRHALIVANFLKTSQRGAPRA